MRHMANSPPTCRKPSGQAAIDPAPGGPRIAKVVDPATVESGGRPAILARDLYMSVGTGRDRLPTPRGVGRQAAPGEVVFMVADRMGERVLPGDEPGEYKGLHFRDALIDLDVRDELPLNLRVRAHIRVEGAEEAP
jgi:hypothetical protein